MFLPDLLAVICSALTFVSLYNYLRNRRRLPLPPGPKRLPLVGNLFDFPTTRHYVTFAQWGKEYGDVVYTKTLGSDLIILNSDVAAKELFDSRFAIYSDRAYIPMWHEPSLMDFGGLFGLKPYGKEWSRERRLFSRYLGRTASQKYHDLQTDAAHSLLRSLLNGSDKLADRFWHASVKTIFAIAYGYQIQESNDPYVEMAAHSLNLYVGAMVPGRYLVNFWPSLKYIPAWMPGAGFKKDALVAKEAWRKARDLPFEDAMRRIAEGDTKPSFVNSVTTDTPKFVSISSIKNLAHIMFGAGGETTSHLLHSCVLAFVLYPEVQSRAQAELDTVIGPVTSPTFRLPTFTDRPRLPYIEAVVKESLRWPIVSPLGVPHAVREDDVYRGWRIPKGSTVTVNIWSMLHNENIYPEPSAFRPERFLGDDPAPHPISLGVFGFGRRECPGRHIAESTIWIFIASILAAFTISPAKDKDGQVIDVNYARDSPGGTVPPPQEFPCVIKPRTREAELRICETERFD